MQNGTKDLMDLMKNIQDPSIHVGPKELTSNVQPKRIYWYSGGGSERGKFKFHRISYSLFRDFFFFFF